MSDTPQRHQSTILTNVRLSSSIWEMTLDRAGMRFQAGHEVLVHGRDHTEDRQYSIASGEQDESLRILYRVIPEGIMSPRLAAMQPGDSLSFTGPFGSFLIRDFLAPMVFVATGTGIAPAVSFVTSHPGLPMTLLHGVRVAEDLVYRSLFDPATYHPCISRENLPDAHHGRVTSLLPSMHVDPETHFYLCGANDMILETRRLLKQRGFPDNQIFSEAYYFW